MRGFIFGSIALAGCSLSPVISPPRAPHATVSLAHSADGALAVQVYSFHAQGSLVTRTVAQRDKLETFYLAPGEYTIEIACLKSFRNAQGQDVRWYVADAASSFALSVVADRSYELNCTPSASGEGFYAAAGT